MKIKFASWVILFQNTLEFKHIIALCYGRQQWLTIHGHVANPQVWVKSTSPNSCEYFGSHGATMWVKQKLSLLAIFQFPCCINFICMSNVGGCLILNSIETHDFDVEFQILWQRMQKKLYKFWSPSFHLCFHFHLKKLNNILVMMLHPHYKELGLLMQYIGKEKNFQITSDYNRQVLFPQLLCTYKFLNLVNLGEKTLSFALKIS